MSGGTSSGLVQTTLVGARVATGKNQTTGRETFLLWTPPYLRANDNKLISSKLDVPCLVNIYGRTEPDHYRLVVWGGRADLFAKNLAKGKEMHWIVQPHSFWANQYYSDGAIILDRNGQPKTVRQMNFTVQDFAWGQDSKKTEFEEKTAGIATGEGLRPQNWNVEGNADSIQWKNVLAARKNTHYMGGDKFGFAKVKFPKDGGTILLGDCSASAVRAAGGEQNFVQQCIQTGRAFRVAAGTVPTPSKPAVGGGMVYGGGVTGTEALVAKTLSGGGACVKCGNALQAGNAFCGRCAHPVQAAVQPTSYVQTQSNIPVHMMPTNPNIPDYGAVAGAV